MADRRGKFSNPETPIDLRGISRVKPANPNAETKVSRRGFSLLRYITQLDIQGHEYETLLADAVHHIRRHYGCTACVIRQRDGNVLRRLASDLRENREVSELLPASQGISDFIIRTKQPIVIRDAESDPITSELFERQKRASGSKLSFMAFASFPMINNNEVVALLGMSFDVKNPPIGRDDEEILQAIANHMASWIRARQAESKYADELRRANESIDRLEKFVGRLQRRYEKASKLIDPTSDLPMPLKRKETTDGLSVLIVEDSTTNVMILRRVLSNIGIVSIYEARDGIEALEKCERKEYGLVLMDLNMPRMDGWEATRRIRKISTFYRNTPIIAVSTSALESDRVRAIEAGVSDFISKPYKIRTVRETLGKFFPTLL